MLRYEKNVSSQWNYLQWIGNKTLMSFIETNAISHKTAVCWGAKSEKNPHNTLLEVMTIVGTQHYTFSYAIPLVLTGFGPSENTLQLTIAWVQLSLLRISHCLQRAHMLHCSHTWWDSNYQSYVIDLQQPHHESNYSKQYITSWFNYFPWYQLFRVPFASWTRQAVIFVFCA